MKNYSGIFVGTMLLLAVGFCGKGGDDDMLWLLALAGGPHETPADIAVEDEPAPDEVNPPVPSGGGDSSGETDATPGVPDGGWGVPTDSNDSDDPSASAEPGDSPETEPAEAGASEDRPGESDGETQTAGGDGDGVNDSDVERDEGESSGDTSGDDVEQSAASCEKHKVRLHPLGGKWYTRGEPEGRLLHTYWKNQKLVVKVLHQCKSGWMRLNVEARNIDGPLPSFYNQFHVQVEYRKGPRAGATAGSMLISASDEFWNTGSLLVYLEEGNPELTLTWTNDAYKKGVYDANIQIGGVSLEEVAASAGAGVLERRGSDVCTTEGRFFWDDAGAIYTYWKDQTAGFCFADLASGQYNVTVEAINHPNGDLPLPESFDSYEVAVAADDASAMMSIPASEAAYQTSFATLDVRGGDTVLLLSWLNDKYKPNQYDANIKIRSVKLERIGDSQRSGLAAYIGGAREGGIVALIATAVVALLGLGLLMAYRMRRKGQAL